MKRIIDSSEALGTVATPEGLCEEFVEELLERGFPIRAIKHEGLDLPRHEFDRIVKTAAGMLASKHICASLGIMTDEEKIRFGFWTKGVEPPRRRFFPGDCLQGHN